MTGQRRIRGNLDDDRHDRHDRQVRADRPPVADHVELEELSVARVLPRGRSRPGLLAVVAAGALVVLLAAGFGALGGKPSASQAAVAANGTSGGSAPPGPTVPGPTAGETPAVTPWLACNPPPAGVPNVLLEVNGTPHPAFNEVLGASDGVIPPPTAIPYQDRVFVSSNLPAELWIEGGACANAWDITLRFEQLGSFHLERLDTLGNAGLNPLYAAQNRFALFLAPSGGGSGDLTAELSFQTMAVRATWHVSVAAYEHPGGHLVSSSGDGRAVEGCNVALTLHDGQATIGEPCSEDLGELPEGLIPVQAGEELWFSIGDWSMESTTVTCGRLSGQQFVADPRADCDDGDIAVPRDGTQHGQVIIPAPRAKGKWTLAIQACASRTDWLGWNEICGTWYANVEVRPAIAG